MRLKPVSVAVVALAVTGITPIPAHGQAAKCAVAGQYNVVGRIPGSNNSYTGTAQITSSMTGCSVRWFPPNDSTGSGTYANGVLTVRFTFTSGGKGTVRYTRAANGELHGVWWMDGRQSEQGTETLRAR